ncbi:MAG: 3'-5' exonuclease [Gammaproteobacteria bacterium]|nr:MAG: 3'-5' exonuclease [Gammaproteobacteria bacterium]
MINNIFVFDIETIPDIETGRKLYDIADLDDEGIARILFQKQLEKTNGASDFLPLYMHKVVAISIVFRQGDQIKVWSLGDLESDESEIVRRFFDGIEKYSPTLVSWNGSGFDLPVLHYRSLKHGIAAPRYWDMGSDDRDMKWNNYISRFHFRHTDLMDVLAAYQPRGSAPLDGLSTMLGFPGKMGMSGASVWEQYQQGELQAIRDYCETDVLNTYLIYLRWELIRGNLDQAGWDRETTLLKDTLRDARKPHLDAFLEAWDG